MSLVQLDNLTVNNIEQYRIILSSKPSIPSLDITKSDSNPSIPTLIDINNIDLVNQEHKMGYFQDLMVGGISFKKHNDKIIITRANVLVEYSKLQVWEALVEHVVEYAKNFKPDLLNEKPTVIISNLELMGFSRVGNEYIKRL